jgi:hypothetical protein
VLLYVRHRFYPDYSPKVGKRPVSTCSHLLPISGPIGVCQDLSRSCRNLVLHHPAWQTSVLPFYPPVELSTGTSQVSVIQNSASRVVSTEFQTGLARNVSKKKLVSALLRGASLVAEPAAFEQRTPLVHAATSRW